MQWRSNSLDFSFISGIILHVVTPVDGVLIGRVTTGSLCMIWQSITIRPSDLFHYKSTLDASACDMGKACEPPHDKTSKSGTCAQWRLRSALASTQSDQRLRCPHEGSLGPFNSSHKKRLGKQQCHLLGTNWVMNGNYTDFQLRTVTVVDVW